MAAKKVVGEAAANERDAEKIRKAAAKELGGGSGGGEEDEEDESEDDEEIELSDSSDDDDEGSVETEPEPKPSRAEKKRERLSLLEAKRELEERAARAEREIAELRGAQQALLQQRQPQTPQADPIAEELKRVRREFQANVAEFHALPETERERRKEEFLSREQELKERELGLMIRRQQPQAPQGDPTLDLKRAFIRQHYPDVVGNDQALEYAKFQHMMMVRNGAPDTLETFAKAAEATRGNPAFKLQSTYRRPAPDARERTRFVGERASSSGAASRSSGTTKIKVTPEIEKMAVSAFPNIAKSKGKKAAIQHWGKTAGKAYLKEMSKET